MATIKQMLAWDQETWTLKGIVQGRPLGHPSHPMFVHMPVALFPMGVAFDVASRVTDVPWAPTAATWCYIAGAVFFSLAVITGLVDWWEMASGSTRKRWATTHMIVQLIAGALVSANVILRFSRRGVPEAEWLWIALAGAGVVVLFAGNWIGGILAYGMGTRVSDREVEV